MWFPIFHDLSSFSFPALIVTRVSCILMLLFCTNLNFRQTPQFRSFVGFEIIPLKNLRLFQFWHFWVGALPILTWFRMVSVQHVSNLRHQASVSQIEATNVSKGNGKLARFNSLVFFLQISSGEKWIMQVSQKFHHMYDYFDSALTMVVT